MKKIYLFRHGETDWNKHGISQGHADIELNETGLEQAKRNAETLKNFNIQYIYSSPLKRALKTAQILADMINVDIEIVDNLKEGSAGDMTGKTKDKLREVFGEEDYKKYMGEYGADIAFATPFPNGESKLDVQNRAIKTLNFICRNNKHSVIAISSHFGVLTGILKYFDFEDLSPLKNCEILEFDYDENSDSIKVIKRIYRV